MIKDLITLINIPRLLLHIIFYIIFFSRCEKDVLEACATRKYMQKKKKSVLSNSQNYECRRRMYFRVGRGNILNFCRLIVFDRYYRNIFYKRIGVYEYLIQFLAPPHPSFIIGSYCTIDEGFVATHSFSTIINAKKIGSSFNVKNNVTIGNSNGGIPTIGDNVNVAVNVVIVGDIHIGHNVSIGRCNLIMHDVPEDCVVVGNPAYIIKYKGEQCKILLKDLNMIQ